MTFRKKPVGQDAVVVDAVWNDGRLSTISVWLDEIAGGCVPIPADRRPTFTLNSDGSVDIETREGTHHCDRGDWLICGADGEFYSCESGSFERTYEPCGYEPG